MYSFDLERFIYDTKIKKIDLATALDVHPSAISKVLSNKMDMPNEWKLKLKAHYKTDLTP